MLGWIGHTHFKTFKSIHRDTRRLCYWQCILRFSLSFGLGGVSRAAANLANASTLSMDRILPHRLRQTQRQMVFRNGQCVDDKCRKGMVGTPPNCTCPPGTTFRDDFCRAPAAPKPNPPPPPKPPAPARCGPNEVLSGGQCVCKARFERVNSQCVEKAF